MSFQVQSGEQRRLLPIFRTIFCLVLALAALSGMGCHRSAQSPSEIQVRYQLHPQPVKVGLENFLFALSDRSGKPISGAHIRVEGDMSHPGMAPVFSDAKETGPGTYAATLHFNMAGDWVVLVHIQLADGRKLEERMNVMGVESH